MNGYICFREHRLSGSKGEEESNTRSASIKHRIIAAWDALLQQDYKVSMPVSGDGVVWSTLWGIRFDMQM